MTSGTTGGTTHGRRDERGRPPRSAPALADGEGLLELPRPLCLRLLAGHDVGRLVFSAAGLPAVVPIAYLLDDQSIVVRTSEDSRVARHAMDTVVAFEVDELEPSVRSGWSVVVTGRTSRVSDPAELTRLRPQLPMWVGGDRNLVLRIGMEMVTGRLVPERPEPAVVDGRTA